MIDEDGNLVFSTTRPAPGHIHCVCCNKLTPMAFSYEGRKYMHVGFIERVTEEATFNLVTGKTEIEVITKQVPVNKWLRGIMCGECALDYSTVTTVHKCSKRCSTPCLHKGEETWFPRVTIIARPSAVTSINPGYSRFHDNPVVEPETRKVTWRSEVGDGTLVFDLDSNQTRQEQ